MGLGSGWRRRSLGIRCRLAATGLIVLGVAIAAGADEPWPRELTKFEAVQDEPVFTAGGEGAWDAAIRERGWILKEGDAWRMWYTGYDGTGEGRRMLGLATSTDGIHWQRHPDNPLYSDDWVEDMQVIKHDGRYLMFAEGKHDRAQLLESPDGVDWTRIGTLDVRLTSGDPIPDGPYGTPTALWKDDTWYLFYERRDAGIWLATSPDLKVFTNVSDDPVLSPGPDGYDRVMVAVNQIVPRGDHYYAYYHCTGLSEGRQLWCPAIARSTDLVHWEKYDGNPLMPPDVNRSSGILVETDAGIRFYTMHGRVEVHQPK